MWGRKLFVVAASVATLMSAAVVTAPLADAKPKVKPPAKVAKARLGAVSSSAASLSWANPKSKKFKATVVRIATGIKAPKSVKAGRSVAVVSKKHHAVAIKQLTPGTVYTVGLFSSDGKKHYSKPVAIRLQTAPAGVSNLSAQATFNTLTLRWAYLPSRTVTGTVVRFARGASAPASPSAGAAVPTRGRATSARVGGLRLGTTYAFSLWARDASGRLSPRSSALFATPSTTSGGLSGMVTGGGKRLAGVSVDVYTDDEDEDSVTSTRTAADGSYRTGSVAPGHYEVCFSPDSATGGTSATGYLYTCVQHVVVTAGDPRTLSAAVNPAYGFTGRVTDEDGNDLVDIHVSAVTDEGEEVGSAHTSEDGSFEISGADAGATRLCAYQHPDEDGNVEFARGCAAGTVTGIAGRFVSGGTIELSGAGSIVGTLTNGVAANADAVVFDSDGTEVERYDVGGAESDDYQLVGLAAGGYNVCFESYSEDYASACIGADGLPVTWDPEGGLPGQDLKTIDVTVGNSTTVNFTLPSN